MKNYKEVAEEVLRRRDEYVRERTRRTSAVRRIGVPVASLGVAAVIGAGVWMGGLLPVPADEIKDSVIQGEIDVIDDKSSGAASDDNYSVNENRTVKGEEAKENESNDIFYEFPWEERSIYGKYPEAQFGGVNYTSRMFVTDEGRIGKALGETVGVGLYDDVRYTKNAVVYEIKGILPECAAALKFDGSDEYCVYVYSEYRPNTLGDFISALNLRENMTFGPAWYGIEDEDGYYKEMKFAAVENSVIWDMLLSNTSAENVYSDTGVYIDVMSVSVNIPALGYENISLAVTEDGYLTTNILDTGKAFYIGEDKTKAFVDYVINNCAGEIVYDDVNTEVPEYGDEACAAVNLPAAPVVSEALELG